MSAPNAAGAGLTSPTPLSPSWLVRRSALLRSPDCASASPEPVKAAVATTAVATTATSATAAVISDDRFFRNVILLSSLRHGAGHGRLCGLLSPFGCRRRYTTGPKSDDRKVKEVHVTQRELRDRRFGMRAWSARCAHVRAQVGVGGLQRDRERVRIAPDLCQEETALNRCEGRRRKSVRIRGPFELSLFLHRAQSVAQLPFPTSEGVGEGDPCPVVRLHELSDQSSDGATAAASPLYLEVDQRIQPRANGLPAVEWTDIAEYAF